MRVVAFLVVGLSSVLATVSSSQRATAQDDTWRTKYPAYYDVVPPGPEQCVGANTYWHDPNLGWRNGGACRDFAPDELGCTPIWIAEAEGLFLFRDPKHKRPMATLGPAGPEALGTGAFDTEFEGGVRATLGRMLGDWYRVEGTFAGGFSWSDSLAVRNLDANGGAGTGNLQSPFSNFGTPATIAGLDNNNFASIAFTSELTNVELNLRRRILSLPGRWESSFLIGARYIDLGESFSYNTTSTTPGPSLASVDYAIQTDNNLIGLQIGLTTQFLVRPRMWVELDLKGGIFANDASMSYTLGQVDNNGAATNFAGAAQRDRTSFLGEIGLDYHYQFAPGWTFIVGYNAYWMTGLAMAVDNFNTDINLLQLGPAQLDHRGETVYHGPNVGLTWVY